MSSTAMPSSCNGKKTTMAAASIPLASGGDDPATSNQPATPQTQSQTPKPKSVPIIGLYGVSGSGKSHLRAQLEEKLDPTKFLVFEGASALTESLKKQGKGSHKEFRDLPVSDQFACRIDAIKCIQTMCAKEQKAGIVTGHFILWSKEIARAPRPEHANIMTDADKEAYTHILYLDTDPVTIVEQVERDNAKEGKERRERTQWGLEGTRTWQKTEREELRTLCNDYGILFTTVEQSSVDAVVELVEDFAQHNESYNKEVAETALDQVVADAGPAEIFLVLDADKTLSPADAGPLYWMAALNPGESDLLKSVFGGAPGYSYNAFRQVMLLYEKSADEALFEKLCEKVAGLIRIHPQFRKILQEVSESESIAVVVLTCGIRRVWEKVLTKLNLRSTITVMGGSRLADGYVMTPELKGSLLDRLKIKHGMYVCSIGDSKIDLDMLKAADESYLVTTEGSISKDMHAKLHAAIETEGLRVGQIILPQGSDSTLSTAIIPPAALDEAFIPRLVQHSARLKVYHATHKPASRLLASRTRNASVYGMQLQEAHKEAGWYLSIEYVSSILGLEPYDMQSVQGKAIQGQRLTHEKRTCIVPMMRGGEPMALGVFEAFPEAMFHHAKNPQDIQSKHLENKDTLILVDWVINTGKGVVDFVKHIRQLSKQIRIVVVAGVVQNRTVGAGGMGGSLHESLADRGEVSLVALRISENSFKGRGGTDTGNRLWNTTHLD